MEKITMKKNNLKIVKIDKNKSLFNYEKKVLIKDLLLDLKLGYYDFEKIKTQKVKFHKGDQRPGSFEGVLSYTKKMKKKKKDIIWQVIEKPTNNVVAEFFFEEDAFKLVKFQNKHKVWHVNGGIPKFLWTRV